MGERGVCCRDSNSVTRREPGTGGGPSGRPGTGGGTSGRPGTGDGSSGRSDSLHSSMEQEHSLLIVEAFSDVK